MTFIATKTYGAASRPPLRAGDFIPVAGVRASSEASALTAAAHAASGRGMSGLIGRDDTHDAAADGSTMWLADGRDGDVWIEFDFGATYPLGEMYVWNYNQALPGFPGMWRRGLRRVVVERSLDGERWTELTGDGYPYELAPADESAALAATGLNDGKRSPIRWNGEAARYVRIRADLDRGGHWGGADAFDRYGGLSAVRFYAGSGWAAEAAPAWDALFRRESGWTGSDGIYSISIDGRDSHGDAASNKTLFLFGDTFLGDLDPATGRRLGMTMINNSMALLDGAEPDPERIRFLWNDADAASPKSAIVPSTEKAAAVEGSYYWLQDGACVDGSFYCFPMIIGPNPDGPEGFQFAVHGVALCRAPMTPDGPDLASLAQIDTPFYGLTAAGRRAYYGAAVMPHTAEAGVPRPDGYVYVYGLLNDGRTRAVAARVLPEHLSDCARWMFWNGSEWTPNPAEAAPISSETSPEYSVSPMRGGPHHGKYVLAYMRAEAPRCVAIQLGDSPVGPFGEEVALYVCPEARPNGGGRYVYNAKAHPSLSMPGELLVSYNVNSTSMDDHVRCGDL